ncbi:MAG: asparagine synthase (glutamine-hydrolyzing), partial [Steroidobacteraceae bacterium]
MCGIAGLVSLSGQDLTERDAALVSTMCDIQAHRGPDDRGVTLLGRAALGSNRLSIIDLSQAGHMPMSDPRTGRWITYNGEVYNFAEVRRELEASGRQFRSHTDTEVVLHAYEEWGVAAFDRFVGMFAFAIYDPPADALILVRDRYGKKPLYYARRGDQLFFASEIKTLVRALGDLKPNHRRLAEWYLYRNVDFGSTETLFEGISALPAGHILEVSRGQVREPRPYYVLEQHVDRAAYEHYGGMSPEAIGSEIEGLVRAGIRDRLVSDVPVGTLCSGGVDSSLITALAADGRKDLLAFNVSVKGQGGEDESRFARQVTDRLGIQLLTLEANRASFRDNLVRAIYFNDQPLTHPNSVYFLLISEFARAHGVKVLLSGEAADEL